MVPYILPPVCCNCRCTITGLASNKARDYFTILSSTGNCVCVAVYIRGVANFSVFNIGPMASKERDPIA